MDLSGTEDGVIDEIQQQLCQNDSNEMSFIK